MTQSQLDAMVALAGMRSATSLQAVELVLVHGYRPADAARVVGLSRAAVGNALARLRLALALARQAAGATPP